MSPSASMSLLCLSACIVYVCHKDRIFQLIELLILYRMNEQMNNYTKKFQRTKKYYFHILPLVFYTNCPYLKAFSHISTTMIVFASQQKFEVIIILCRIPNQCPKREIMMFVWVQLYPCVQKISGLNKKLFFFVVGQRFTQRKRHIMTQNLAKR